VTTHRSFRTALGVAAVAAFAFAGSVSADILHFGPAHDAASPPSHSPRQCWEWNASEMDWTWICRLVAYRSTYPGDPLQPPAPVRYDYPSYGPGISGSSIAFVAGRRAEDKETPPAHAD
jgi:hypothetical protein